MYKTVFFNPAGSHHCTLHHVGNSVLNAETQEELLLSAPVSLRTRRSAPARPLVVLHPNTINTFLRSTLHVSLYSVFSDMLYYKNE